MPRDERDYKVEIGGLSGESPARRPESQAGRPFLSVQFACCGVYRRIYRSADGTAYAGRCPRCGKPVRFAVGAGGTTCRFFVVR